MEFLPDELWLQAVQMGIQRKSLGHYEICRLAMVSRRFRRLCSLDSLWKGLWEVEFGSLVETGAGTSKVRPRTKAEKDAPDWKAAYRIRYDSRNSALRMSHVRVVLAVQSEIAGLQYDCNNLQRSIAIERSKLLALCVDHSHLKHARLLSSNPTGRARRATTALQIWQPQVVRTRHEMLVQQQPLDIDSRCHLLEMEIRVCKNLISTYERSLAHKRHLIDMRVKRLEFLTSSSLQVSVDRLERGKDPTSRSLGRKRKLRGEEHEKAFVAGAK